MIPTLDCYLAVRNMAALPNLQLSTQLRRHCMPFVNFGHALAMRAASRACLLMWTIKVFDNQEVVVHDVLARLGVHRGGPELLRHHLAEALEALHRRA